MWRTEKRAYFGSWRDAEAVEELDVSRAVGQGAPGFGLAVAGPDLQCQFSSGCIATQVDFCRKPVGLGAARKGRSVKAERRRIKGPAGRCGIGIGGIYAQGPAAGKGGHGQLVIGDGGKDMDGNRLHQHGLDTGAFGARVDTGLDIGREGSESMNLGRE